MQNKGYYAMTFYNTTDTMQTEKKARERFSLQVMPTPRVISTSCGLALRFEEGDGQERAYIDFAKEQPVPLGLYHIVQDETGNLKAQTVYLCEPQAKSQAR